MTVELYTARENVRLGWRMFAILIALYTANIGALPSSPKYIFRRLSDGVQSTRCSRCQSDVSLLRNRHRCAYANGRLYFLSLKGKRQPNFGTYHETALYGGYVSIYGVGENETDGNDASISSSSSSWSWSHIHFDAIDKNENREDAFFVLENTLFLLIYTRFENVTFRNLYAWQRRAWINVPLTVDSRSQFLDGTVQNGRLAWTKADSEIDRLYLIATDGWGGIIVSRLDITFDDQRSIGADQSIPISASITYVTSDESTSVNSAGLIVTLTHRAGRLYGFYGWHGCGFHWESRRLLVVDLNSTSTLVHYMNVTMENESDLPPWSFNGPTMTERYESDWVMIGGNVPSGATSAVFDGRIWIFNLDTLRWKKTKRSKVPDYLHPYDLCSAIDYTGRMMYLADFKNIYVASLEHLIQL